jgi:arginyl-tRNA synthetase
MKEVYSWAQVEFDVWYWESDVDADSLKLAKEYFEKGLFVESEGAIGIDLADFKLGFCLLIKSDGNGLYATKDIELARKKFTQHKIEKSIYVVDKRQALHFQQVFKTLELMGFENAKNCHHLQYDFVELPDGAMSSRKGNIVPLQSLVDEMVAMIKREYLSKYESDWTSQEIDKTANDVARGAIKYGMIRLDNNKKIVFDMKEWLKLDGESGPYIQYSYARIHSLCEKLGYHQSLKADWSQLKEPQEIALLQKLTGFNDVAIISAEQYKTGSMCSYLYDLSKLFNSFYAECSVQNAGTEELKTARLLLCKSVSVVLEKGLNILGIPAPKRM